MGKGKCTTEQGREIRVPMPGPLGKIYGEKSLLRMTLLIFPEKSHGPGASKLFEACPPTGTGTKRQFPSRTHLPEQKKKLDHSKASGLLNLARRKKEEQSIATPGGGGKRTTQRGVPSWRTF